MKKQIKIASITAYGDTGFSLTLANEKGQSLGTIILSNEEYEKLGSPLPRETLMLDIERLGKIQPPHEKKEG